MDLNERMEYYKKKFSSEEMGASNSTPQKRNESTKKPGPKKPTTQKNAPRKEPHKKSDSTKKVGAAKNGPKKRGLNQSLSLPLLGKKRVKRRVEAFYLVFLEGKSNMLKRFISYYRPYKGLFTLDMSAAVIGSLLSIAFPQITRELLRNHIPNKNWQGMMTLFIIMLCIYVVQIFTTYLRVRWGHIMGVYMESDMRQDLFEHLQRQSFTYFDNTKTGHLMSRITNDLFMITETAHHGPEDFLISVTVIIGSYIVMFMNSVPLALISIVPLPFMLFYGIHFGRQLKEGFRRVRSTVADVNSMVENSIQGVREVQSYTSEKEENKKFMQVNQVFQKAKVINMKSWLDMNP